MNLAWAVRISGDGGQEGRHLEKKGDGSRTGRIVNRLSSDLQKVDTMLQGTMQYLLLQAPGRREPSHRCMKPGKTKGMLGHFRPVVPIWTIIAKQSLYTKLIEYVRQFSVYLCVRII